MKKTIIAAAAFAAALSFTAPAAFAQKMPPPGGGGGGGAAGLAVGGSHIDLTLPAIFGGCVVGIIVAGAHANWANNRQLTAPEAWTCGILYWFAPPTPPKKARKRG
jgi:hypothetical protein